MLQDDDVEKGLPEAHAEEETTPKKLAVEEERASKKLADGDEAEEIKIGSAINDEENSESKTAKNLNSINDQVEGEDETAGLFIQQRMHAISSVMGDVTPPYNRVKGYVGMVVWIFHFTAHFSFDFYEVKVSWMLKVSIKIQKNEKIFQSAGLDVF